MGRPRRGSWVVSCGGALVVAACGAFSSTNDSPPVGSDGPSDAAGTPDGAFVPPSEDGMADARGATSECPCPDASQKSSCESFASLPSARQCGWKAEPSSLSFGYTPSGLVVPADTSANEGFLSRTFVGLTSLSVDVTTSLSEMQSLSGTAMYLETGTMKLAFILYKGADAPTLGIGLSGGETADVPLSGTFKVTFVFDGTRVATKVEKGGAKILETMTDGALTTATIGVGIHHVTTPLGSGSIAFSNFRATFD